MVTIRRNQRIQRHSGFGAKPLVILMVAIVLLVMWGFHKVLYQQDAHWLLAIAILLAVVSFGTALAGVWRLWRRSHSKGMDNK